MTLKFRKPYDRSLRVLMPFTEEDMTIQSAKQESDINHIVNRYQRTGTLPPNPRGQEPRYEDCTEFQGDITEMHEKSMETLENYKTEYEAAQAAQEASDDEDDDTPPSPTGRNKKREPVDDGGASPPSKSPPKEPAPPSDAG